MILGKKYQYSLIKGISNESMCKQFYDWLIVAIASADWCSWEIP